MTRLLRVPVVIIGGGPSGLCASHILHKHGIEHILCESGAKVSNRSQHKPRDITHGIGGAGLYSDGKFSFYPSGTKLWQLNEITESFSDTMNILSNYGLHKNDIHHDEETINTVDHSLKLKLYPSLYLNFETRFSLIKDLEMNLSQYIWPETTVTNITFDEYSLKYKLNLNYNENKFIETDYIIFCGGRYFPLFLTNKTGNNYLGETNFQRYEFGIRIEMSINSLFWNTFGYNGYNDPKYIFIDDENEDIEFRTFCFCKRGLVVKTDTFGINTFSGRADCRATSVSNFGFNARIYNDDCNSLIKQEISNWSENDNTFCENVNNIGDNINYIEQMLTEKMGMETGSIMTRGLNRLLSYFPLLNNSEMCLYGPTLEGVGKYPILNSLSWKSNTINDRLFCAGDCTGIFRGIVASMTSGNYAARQIIHSIGK